MPDRVPGLPDPGDGAQGPALRRGAGPHDTREVRLRRADEAGLPGWNPRRTRFPEIARMCPDPRLEHRAFAFRRTEAGALEGVLIPYDVPLRTGGGFDELFEPRCLLVNDPVVTARHNRRRPLARFGAGLAIRNGPDALRATVTLPDTPEGRRTEALVRARILTGFCAGFQVLSQDWPAPDRRIVRLARLVDLAIVELAARGKPGDRQRALRISKELQMEETGNAFTGTAA
ncbi:MAG: HK97 family phage prohead protease [Alphaproteobacteria bacterium]|nr:HK97 family phage prohead protease [Alphaproteobacteria bacterium]